MQTRGKSVAFIGLVMTVRAFVPRQATSSAAELRQLPLEEIRGRCPEEVEDARMYVARPSDIGGDTCTSW